MSSQKAQRTEEWKSLLQAARHGDDDAFGEICNRVSEYLLLTANDLGDGLSAKIGASDIVQQSLLEARNDIGSFRGADEYEFRNWLVRLVQNNLLDITRKYRKTQKRDVSREHAVRLGDLAEGDAAQKTASSIVQRADMDEELLRALAQLPARRRRIIELRHWEGMDFNAIGKELKISAAASRKLLARALEELRTRLTTSHVN